jgi:hypothetical protein
MPPLPPGIDPIHAGRLGLWLLSRRSHRAASRRIAFPYRRTGGRLARRVADLICPWDIFEYPGAIRFFSALLGISRGSAKRYLATSCEIPRKHAVPLAVYLEHHAAECQALAIELRAYAAGGARHKKTPHS